MTDHLVEHEHVSDVHHDEHDHGDGIFWKMFVILFVLTAVEVAWVETGWFSGVALWAPLILMMFAKFWIVAAYFMHLKFDLWILNGRLFTWAFVGSLILAIAVYAAVFATMIDRL
jgi:heme/copper-type cytochrome/quinol oxidase subunit 4